MSAPCTCGALVVQALLHLLHELLDNSACFLGCYVELVVNLTDSLLLVLCAVDLRYGVFHTGFAR